MNLKPILLGALLVVLIWIGYVTYALITVQPRAEARWGNANEKTTKIIISVDLGHPLLVPISLKELSLNFTGARVESLKEFKYWNTKGDMELSLLIDNNNLTRSLINYMNRGTPP